MFIARFMPKVNLGSRYHSCVNHLDVKTPDKRLAQGVHVLSREESTPSMIKHLEHRSSENCLASGRAFKTQIIALEHIFIANDCFHCFNNLPYLIFQLPLVLVYHRYRHNHPLEKQFISIFYIYIGAFTTYTKLLSERTLLTP